MMDGSGSRFSRRIGSLTGVVTCAYMAACGDAPPATEGTSAETGIVSIGESSEGESSGSTSASSSESSSEGDTVMAESTGECAEVHVTVTQVVPTMILLIDQSSSMTEDFGGTERWTAVYETLMDPDDGVVARLDERIRFGLALYSSENGSQGGVCPLLTEVAPTLGGFAEIDAVFGQAHPIDDTPTGESLAAVADQLAAFAEPGPKAIVLATDGEPDTCAQPDPQEGQALSIAAAESAYAAGIATHVISVGAEVSQAHLQALANVGAGRAADTTEPAPYYQALAPDELVAAFDAIVGDFVSCTFALEGEVEPAEACDGTVSIDGEPLDCGDEWRLIDASTIELLGDACERLKDGASHSVAATFPCGAVFIP